MIFFSEYGHVTKFNVHCTYQIKSNETYDKLQTNFALTHTPGPWGEVKTFLLKVVMLHIKLRRRVVMHTGWVLGGGFL